METIDSIQTVTIEDIPYLLRRRWKLVLACTVAGAIFGGYKSVGVPVLFKSQLLLRIEEMERMQSSNAEITRMTEDFRLSNPTEGELEVVKSRSILSEVVRRNGLGLSWSPQISLKNRILRKPKPTLKVGYFHAPDSLLGRHMLLKVLEPGRTYALLDESGALILRGAFRSRTDSTSSSSGIRMLVKDAANSPAGQIFDLYNDERGAISRLGSNLDVEQVGRQTGLLRMTLLDNDGAAAADNLNAVADVYIEQSVRRRSAEAEERFANLNRQLPSLKDSMETAAERLKNYKLRVGSLNTDRETDQILSNQSDLTRQILALETRRKEALQKYTMNHFVVRSLDSTLGLLRSQMGRVSAQIHILPVHQRELAKLEQAVTATSERYSTVLKEANQLQLVQDQTVANVKVIDPAIFGEMVSRRGKGVMLAIGGFIGFLLGAALTLALRYLLPGVVSAKIVETLMDVPILSLIPHVREQAELNRRALKGEKSVHLLAVQHPFSIAVESMRNLNLTVRSALSQSRSKLILFASPSPLSGKSTVAGNYAAIYAQTGARVLLMDADMRKGMQHSQFGQKLSPGLSELLSGRADLESCIYETLIPGVHLLPAGSLTNRSTALIQSPALDPILERLSASFDAIVVDTPPILPLTDAQELAIRAAGTFLVLRHGKHFPPELIALRKRMELCGAKVLGVIFNDIPRSAPIDGLALHKQVYEYRASQR